MITKTSFEIYKKEREYLKKINKEHPELFIAENIFNEEHVLSKIGICGLPQNRYNGFIKLYPQDFIVEEIHDDETISEIEFISNQVDEPKKKRFTLYADLIKVSIPTFEAVNRLSKNFNILMKDIGYAGIKDAQALTSQLISLREIRYEQVKDRKCEGFFLSNFFYGKGILRPGALAGNRFVIFIRTDKMVKEEWLKERLGNLKRTGFLNYYQTQRFGGLRLMSHIFGKLILQQKYEETIKLFLTEPSYYDMKLIKDIRLKAGEYYGDWLKMKEIFIELPYVFQNEIRVLDYLSYHPKNFIGALSNIQEQTTLWIYAYSSFLFNSYLSKVVKNGDVLPEKLPLVLSDKMIEQRMYKEWLDRDSIVNIAEAVKPFRFIQLKSRLLTTKIFPKNIIAMSTSEGVACSFCLPKGAYATTFLMNLFELQQGTTIPGLPMPEWVKDTEVDAKELLELGSIASAKELLKDYIVSALNFK